MYTRKLLVVCLLAVTTMLVLAGCGRSENAATSSTATSSTAASPITAMSTGKLAITGWGPQMTKAGEAFNVQPDGSAAMWIRLDQSLGGNDAVIEFNGTQLPTVVSGNLVTAEVPAKLYASPGNFNVHVIAHKGGQSVQSDDVTFAVK